MSSSKGKCFNLCFSLCLYRGAYWLTIVSVAWRLRVGQGCNLTNRTTVLKWESGEGGHLVLSLHCVVPSLLQLFTLMQCIQKVFRPLVFFHILLHYIVILKCIKLFFPLMNLHTIPHNDKAKTFFWHFCKCIKNNQIYISIQTLYSVLCWSTFGSQILSSSVRLGKGGGCLVSFPTKCIQLKCVLGSFAAQLFSGLSRDVRSGSSPGSSWATQGHSETWPKALPCLRVSQSLLCA